MIHDLLRKNFGNWQREPIWPLAPACRGNYDARTSHRIRACCAASSAMRSICPVRGPSTGGDLLNLGLHPVRGPDSRLRDSKFDFKPYPAYSGMLVSDLVTLMAAYTRQTWEWLLSDDRCGGQHISPRQRSRDLNGITQAPDGSALKPIPWVFSGRPSHPGCRR